MAFTGSIAEQALLECGRCCCICHRFCGFKIELHHIIQKADNGEDTFENCIPLCFDCHAEVRAYNPKHPKGRKYTESELRQHRNRWNDKVKSTNHVVVNPDCFELDKKLFLKIREILPSEKGSSILFIRKYVYTDPFLGENHNDLYQYRILCEDPTFEFIDSDLEARKSQLTESIKKFLEIISGVVFTSRNWVNDSTFAIYPELKGSPANMGKMG